MLPDGVIKNRWRELLKDYYEWKYWLMLIKCMRSKQKKQDTISKNKTLPYKEAGICFSFDDSFRIRHWYKYGREIFGHYGVKATFNINAFHHFEGAREHTQKEIDMLLELQSDGHEIAHHGYRHMKAPEYSKEFGIDKWVDEEILPLFKWMEKQSHSKTHEKFKRPVSYVFPHFLYNEDLIEKVVPEYFKVVRGHHCGDNLTSFNHTGFVPSICIDRKYLTSRKYIKRIMKLAKESGKSIIFTCHSILPDDVNWESFDWGSEAASAGWYRISPKTIQWIISEARKMDMPFYTTSEIAGVATFMDRHLEKCVREQLADPGSKWISIDELDNISKLDLKNKGISNLDGIQYITNLETLNLTGNTISDFKLLNRLPKLSKVIIDKKSSKMMELNGQFETSLLD